MPEESARPGPWALLRAFSFIGTVSMGGGRFTFFYHEFVRRRGWLSDAQIIDSLAISQVLPGPNIGNLAVLLGGRLRRLPGAVLALLGVLVPGALMMLGLSALYFSGRHIPALDPLLKGVAAAAAGMAIATAVQVGQIAVRSPLSVLLTLAAIGLIVLHLPTLLVVVVLGLAGTLLHRARRRPAPEPQQPEEERT